MTAKKKTTARTTGLTGNQFASVEQGRSYVLSVHSPSGAGEIELLAADSDQQSEPDMFSMLYEKIETARQIPFVAISPFVFVNVGNSDVQYLVTPANFSIAVPGASSGGGSSFDPTADQSITGAWTFKKPIEVATPFLSTQATNKQYVDEELEKYVTLDTEQTLQGVKNFEGNIGVRTISTDITYNLPTDKTIIWTLHGNTGDMRMYMYNSTLLLGIQPSATGGGLDVANNGNVTCENSLTVRGNAFLAALYVSNKTTFNGNVVITGSNRITSSIISQKDLTDTMIAPVGTNDQRYIKYLSMTEAEYKALGEKANNCIYYLTDKSMWAIGDKEIVTSDMPA